MWPGEGEGALGGQARWENVQGWATGGQSGSGALVQWGSALFDAGEEQQHLGASARLEPVLGSVGEPPQVRHDGGVVELAAAFLPVLVQHVVCELRVHLPVGEDVNAQRLERVGVLLLQRIARGAEGLKDLLGIDQPTLRRAGVPRCAELRHGYTGVAL